MSSNDREKDYRLWFDGVINRKKKKNFFIETISEYICLFPMSFYLKQYFRNMVLGRRAEGHGLGINRG